MGFDRYNKQPRMGLENKESFLSVKVQPAIIPHLKLKVKYYEA